jgi:hypothetical protein
VLSSCKGVGRSGAWLVQTEDTPIDSISGSPVRLRAVASYGAIMSTTRRSLPVAVTRSQSQMVSSYPNSYASQATQNLPPGNSVPGAFGRAAGGRASRAFQVETTAAVRVEWSVPDSRR